MTQKDKDLLLKDLCARLPYGVMVREDTVLYDDKNTTNYRIKKLSYVHIGKGFSRIKGFNHDYEYIYRPYLFPLSSMTEEQKRELLELTGYEPRCEESGGFDSWGFYVNIVGEYEYEDGKESIILYPDDIGIDWCNKNHFDYRDLIPKDLAIDATGLNIY